MKVCFGAFHWYKKYVQKTYYRNCDCTGWDVTVWLHTASENLLGWSVRNNTTLHRFVIYKYKQMSVEQYTFHTFSALSISTFINLFTLLMRNHWAIALLVLLDVQNYQRKKKIIWLVLNLQDQGSSFGHPKRTFPGSKAGSRWPSFTLHVGSYPPPP